MVFTKDRLRVLSLSNCDLNESKGSGYVIANFARGLASRGHEVCLLGPRDLIILPNFRGANQARLALGMLLAAKRRVAKEKWDIVEFYGGEAWLATAELSKVSNRKFAIVAHSNGIEPYAQEVIARSGICNTWDGKPKKWYQGWIRPSMEPAFRRADAIITVSTIEAQFAEKKGYRPADRILAINNSLLDSFLKLSFIESRNKIAGYCGSWLARKGKAALLSDIPIFLRRFEAWRFQLVGIGNGDAAQFGFPPDVAGRISIIPHISDKEELKRVYTSWAISVVPSVYESFGLVTAEAMACGCAVVATPTGFGADLKHLNDSVIMDEIQSPQLADALSLLAGDEPLRRRIAANGYQRVQSLNWAAALNRYERFLYALSADF